MNLSFALDEDDDILNMTVRDSDTGSVMYTVETLRYAKGALTTTVTRRNQINGSTRFAFRILWMGTTGPLDSTRVVLDDRTSEDVPTRDILEKASGGSTYGSLIIEDIVYKWRCKGMGSKVVLVTGDDNAVVVESHSRRRGSFFRKPRDMSLEISEIVAPAVDVILLTFILVWRERQREKAMAPTLPNESEVAAGILAMDWSHLL